MPIHLHENMDVLCYALSNFSCFKNLQLYFKTASTANSYWNVTVCNIINEECVKHRCIQCSTNNICQFFEPLEKFFDEETTISQWYVTVEKEAGKSIIIIKEVQQNLSVDIALSMHEEKPSSFSVHNNTKIIQLLPFKFQKENLEHREIIISEDFSEIIL